MTNHSSIDGDRIYDVYLYGETSVVLSVKRYNGGMRGGILVFGGEGTLGTINFNDKMHGTDTHYHAATGLQFNCKTIADDGIHIQIEVSNLNGWTWYTFIGCNCWFM